MALLSPDPPKSALPRASLMSPSDEAAGPSRRTERAFLPGEQENSFAALWNFIISLSYVVALP